MAKKELVGPDKLQFDKAVAVFEGMKWPGDASDITDALKVELKKRGKEFLRWREKFDTVKLPTIRAIHFPHYTAYAACMTVSAEESLDTWVRRLNAGRNVRSKDEENARVIAKAKKLFDQLKEMGISVTPEMLAKLTPKAAEDDEDDDADVDQQAPPSADEDDDADETPAGESPVPAGVGAAQAPQEGVAVAAVPAEAPKTATPEPAAPVPSSPAPAAAPKPEIRDELTESVEF